MNSTLIRLLQHTPGFRSLAARIHPVWFFRVTRWCIIFTKRFDPHARARLRVFQEVLRAHFPEKELRARGVRYLFYSRLFKDLEIAWNNWHHWQSDWILLEGECYLKDALAAGRGAVLVSPLNYGFSKLVAPVLADRGYAVHRGGNGGAKAAGQRMRWGEGKPHGWNYLDYKNEYWVRVQLLRSVQKKLAKNEIVHVSVRGFESGDEDRAIEIFGRKYFLDEKWLRVLQLCGAPTLPCFAVARPDYKIKIVLHAALEPGEKMARQLAALQADYIMRFPECGRLWKNIYAERARW